MGATSNYFLDGPNLASSSAVYTDLTLTTKAPDGFYSDNQIVREQVNGILQDPVVCGDCALDCDTIINVSSAQSGYYTANFETTTAIGVVRVVFNPFNCADGFRFVEGTSVFNEVSSQNFGYLSSSNAGNFVVLGNSAAAGCGNPVPGAFSLDKYIFEQNGQFVQITGSESVVYAAGDSGVQAGAPGECVGYFVNSTNTNKIIETQIAATYNNSDFEISVECPQVLIGSDIANECGEFEGEAAPIYNVPVNGDYGLIGLYDWVFTDNMATNKVAAGDYVVININSTITVDANGVVINIVPCPVNVLKCFNINNNSKSEQSVTYNNGSQIVETTVGSEQNINICALQGSINTAALITGGTTDCTDNDDCVEGYWIAELCASYPAFFGTTQVIVRLVDEELGQVGIGRIVQLSTYGSCWWRIIGTTSELPSDTISALLPLENSCDDKCYTYTVTNSGANNATFSYTNCSGATITDTIVGLGTKTVCSPGTSFTLSKFVSITDEECGCSG